MPDETVKIAVESNNYSALSETAKAKITQEKFDVMVAKKAEREVIEAAIEAGDYAAFKNASIAQIPTEAEFQKMVAVHKARDVARAQIETAVKNNDFAAFKAALEIQKSQMAELHSGDSAPEAPSDAKLQEHFNKLVEYYKTNGKLPEMRKGFGPMGGKGIGVHGPHMGRRE